MGLNGWRRRPKSAALADSGREQTIVELRLRGAALLDALALQFTHRLNVGLGSSLSARFHPRLRQGIARRGRQRPLYPSLPVHSAALEKIGEHEVHTLRAASRIAADKRRLPARRTPAR